MQSFGQVPLKPWPGQVDPEKWSVSSTLSQAGVSSPDCSTKSFNSTSIQLNFTKNRRTVTHAYVRVVLGGPNNLQPSKRW